MLYIEIQPQSFLGSWEEYVYVVFFFFTIYGHDGDLVQWPGTIWKLWQYLLTEGPMWNLVKIAQAVFEKKLKNYTNLYMYVVQG